MNFFIPNHFQGILRFSSIIFKLLYYIKCFDILDFVSKKGKNLKESQANFKVKNVIVFYSDSRSDQEFYCIEQRLKP